MLTLNNSCKINKIDKYLIHANMEIKMPVLQKISAIALIIGSVSLFIAQNLLPKIREVRGYCGNTLSLV